MAVVHNPDGSITVGIIPTVEPKPAEKEKPAPVKRGGRTAKKA